MTEHRTDLIVSAKPEGFQDLERHLFDVQEKTNRSNQSIIDGLEKAKRAADKTLRPDAKSTDSLAKLIKEQQALTDLMLKSTDKSGKEYEKLTGVIENLETAFGGVTDQILKMNRAREEQVKTSREERAEERKLSEARRETAKADRTARREAAEAERAAKGSFGQGFLQAAMPSPAMFLQRGPGMRRQMLGMIAGGAVGGMAAGPFSGLGGLQQGLSALPFGGVAAGMLGNVAGWGGQALGLERQQVGMMPFMGAGQGYLERVSAAARAVPPAPKRTKKTATGVIEDIVGSFIETEEQRDARETLAARGFWLKRSEGKLPPTEQQGKRQKALRRLAEERNRPFAGIVGAGEKYGYGAQESMQFAQQILMAGGGGGEDLAASGLGTGGFALQRAYGLQAPTIGAFQMAGRRGGLAGGGGGSAAAVGTIAGAVRMGLEGSELTEYMQIVASGIESFKSTGIPFADKSIERMSGTLARVGITGPRGTMMAGAVTSAAQNLSATGIQSPFQLAMMKHLGGFAGGGFEGAFDAMTRMESGNIATGGMESLFRERMMMGGGGKRGAAFLSAELQSIGVRLPFGSAAMMGRVYEGKESTEDLKELAKIQRQLTGTAAGAPASMADVEKRAAGFVGAAGPNLKTQVQLQNDQLRIGQKMLPVLQSLEISTTETAKQFTRLSGGLIKDYADAVAAMTGGLKGAVGWLQSIGFTGPPIVGGA